MSSHYESPQEREARVAETREILDYRPKLGQPLPPAVPASATGQELLTVGPHVVQSHALHLLAGWHDFLGLQTWLRETLPSWQAAIAHHRIPLSGDVLPAPALALLEKLLGKKELTFADVLHAHQHPEAPTSAGVKRLWSRHQFGPQGSIEAALFFHAWRIHTHILPALEHNGHTLLRLFSHVIDGTVADPISVLAHATTHRSHSHKAPAIAGYDKMIRTFGAQVCDLHFTVQSMVNAVHAQKFVGAYARDFLTELGTVYPALTVSGHSSSAALDSAVGSGAAQAAGVIAKIISVLEMIRTLYTIQNDYAFLNMDALEQRLDQFLESLLYQLLGEAAAILGHVETMLMSPVVGFVEGLDGLAGGAAAPALTTFADQITRMLGGIVGKFESHLLDLYRHGQLHNSLTLQSTDQQASNNTLRNLIAIIDQLIAALQALESALDQAIDWTTIIGNIGLQFDQQATSLPNFPALPTLAQTNPPPNASLSTMLSPHWGLSLAGESPGQIASGLATIIRSLQTN